MKTFFNVVNSIICCAKEARTSIALSTERVQFVLQIVKNCILFEVCMIKKTASYRIFDLRCDV